MQSDPQTLWQRFLKYRCECPSVGMRLDISRMNFEQEFLDGMEGRVQEAYRAMRELEGGAAANVDEGRMVGHYWLRAPRLAPSAEIRGQIEGTLRTVERFGHDVRERRVKPPGAARFTDVLIVGIGGSALGPQLLIDALGPPRPGARGTLAAHFLDNTDPDGFDRTLARLGGRLKSTLVVVISKSGGTRETRNGMVEVEAAMAAKGLDFAKHAVAVTGEGSELDKRAQKGAAGAVPDVGLGGGRTSVTSAVGLLPGALAGVDARGLLEGAAEMDGITRGTKTAENPAALLALMWHAATDGAGARDMVILPYKDRLILLSRYLQQLIMESLGKGKDLAGRTVNQGIAVYGNKGSTDQHAFVQQLREGVDNFFVTFIVVLRDREPGRARRAPMVEADVRSGDYLNGFWQGTREALAENGRQSITIKVQKLDARSVGALIALYERAVGLYASLVNINAYHQPGVEAGKKAAASVLEIQGKALAYLRQHPQAATPLQVAAGLGVPQKVETVHHVLEHLAAGARGVRRVGGGFRWEA